MTKIKNFNRTIFLDSSSIEEVKKWNATGVISGITTNQYILLQDGIKPSAYFATIKKICKEMKGKPVSVELTDSTLSKEKMVHEAKRLNSIAENIVVKVPMIPDTTKSLEVINELTRANISVNVTTMMTFEQLTLAILAASHCKKISFVSLFWGRSMEDYTKYSSRSDFMANYPKVGIASHVNSNPHNIVRAAASFIKEGGYENIKIIAGSIRTAAMVGQAFEAGANIVTTAPDKLMAMLFSQRSIETIEQFDNAWKQLQKRK